MTLKCEACSGRGQLLGLGAMMRDCTKCGGVGYTQEIVQPIKQKRKKRSVKECPSKDTSLLDDQQPIHQS